MKDYVLKYIKKNYAISGKDIVEQLNGFYIPSGLIISDISEIFALQTGFVLPIVRQWVESNGLDWEYVTLPLKLKTVYSPEMTLDITGYYGSYLDVECEMVTMLSETINNELGFDLLSGLRTIDGFLTRMNDVGYSLGPTIYEPTNFSPIRHFIRNEE